MSKQADRTQTKFTRICRFIYDSLEKRREISEETVADFIYGTADHCQNNAKIQDFDYYEVINKCRKYKTFYMDEKERFAFNMGVILGAGRLHEAICEKQKDERYEKRWLQKSSEQYKVLKLIDTHPGLTKKQLKEKLQNRITSSALTRLLKKLEERNYIVRLKTGQTDSYYAAEKSQNLVIKHKKIKGNK